MKEGRQTILTLTLPFCRTEFVFLSSVPLLARRHTNLPPSINLPPPIAVMLPTDMALIEDPQFKPYVELYAEDRKRFFKDFSSAFATLIELGVDRSETYELAEKKSDEIQGKGSRREKEEEALKAKL